MSSFHFSFSLISDVIPLLGVNSTSVYPLVDSFTFVSSPDLKCYTLAMGMCVCWHMHPCVCVCVHGSAHWHVQSVWNHVPYHELHVSTTFQHRLSSLVDFSSILPLPIGSFHLMTSCHPSSLTLYFKHSPLTTSFAFTPHLESQPCLKPKNQL